MHGGLSDRGRSVRTGLAPLVFNIESEACAGASVAQGLENGIVAQEFVNGIGLGVGNVAAST